MLAALAPATFFATMTLPEWRAEVVEEPAWYACRSKRGVWCVKRRGTWEMTLTLTGAVSVPDDRLEAHARVVAAALDRLEQA